MSSFHQISSSSVSFNTIFSKIDRGVIVALLVIGTWAISLGGLLSIDVSSLPIAVKMAAMVWQTFLYTGLFITAHDGMHGAIAPSHPKLNHGIGSFAVIAYALFSYKQMIRMHWMHHQHPASAQDPDFHDGKHQNFFAWYFHFMMHYWSWTRVLGLVLLYHFMHHVLHIAEINLVLFWMIPSIASSVQLFFFGTYLPHREPETGYQNESRAQSSNWSSFWSFMTCYHFGYHLEHHENPHLPWWKLPEIHQRRLLEMS